MAVNPVIVKRLIVALSDKRVWKAILVSFISVLALIAIILLVFISIISGIFGIFLSFDTQTHWSHLTSNLSDVFSRLNTSIDSGVKAEVYNFMPEFSINLSKAALSNDYDNLLLVYDSAELRQANEKTEEIINEIRENPEVYGVSDSYFLNDTGYNLSDYSDDIQNLIFTEVKASMNNYAYEYEDFVTDEGESARRQTLTVSTEDGVKIVEYVCVGATSIYIPEFMALYQVRNSNKIMEMDETDITTEILDSDIEEAVGNIPNPEETEESKGFITMVWDGISSTFSDHSLGNLNVFEVTELTSILHAAIDNGLMGVETEYTSYDNVEKLTIILKSPSDEKWKEAFEITEELENHVSEVQGIIEQVLDEASIPTEERYISIDGMVQAALFSYFEGFFNLPVESTDLKSGTNGMLNVFGKEDKIHKSNHYVVEEGVTLMLENPSTPVYMELLPVGDCIDNIVVSSVWNANDHPIDRGSLLYNYSAVELAFYINTDVFEEDYGFPFPSFINARGEYTSSSGDYVTMYVEYACLDRLGVIEERDVGYSISSEQGERVLIGYSHNGAYDSDRDYSRNFEFYHSILDEDIPHIRIRMSFIEGYSERISNTTYYNGLSAHTDYVRANPRLWFKAFRTDLNSDMYDTLVPIVP